MNRKLLALVVAAILRRRRIKKKRRQFWVHPLNTLRSSWGEHLKIDEMKRAYPDKFFEYTRMSPVLFDVLLEKLHPVIKKKLSNFRVPIESNIRLYVTLR